MFSFTAELWLWKPDSSWHFVALPQDIADRLDDAAAGPRAGFGSIPVRVAVGAVSWETSVFPDRERGTYVLPVKRAVRAALGVGVGDALTMELTPRHG